MEDDATQLVIQLEDNLGLGEVRNGIPLIGVLMTDKFPNQGAIKGILRKSWEQMGEVKISVVKDNLNTLHTLHHFEAIWQRSHVKEPCKGSSEYTASL
ncbi:unnamed protein product [Prunus armeniaca]|uniref:Uncharacterized protein n=1 Tax=Prunus armeniaca TaxID=36596 RepID=A0A6J5U0J5_PRUAR|nr:unnamed protein product [Prunus armeniaca]